MLVSWIKSTLTEHALTQFVRLKSGFEILKSLELQYSTCSRSRKAKLHLQLQTLRKGTSNVTDYLHRAKSIADRLAAIGYSVSNEDLILAIVGGLPKSYDNLYMHVTSNSDPTSTEELQSLMLSQEVRLESQEQDDVPVNPPTTAFVATKSSSSQPPRGQSSDWSVAVVEAAVGKWEELRLGFSWKLGWVEDPEVDGMWDDDRGRPACP
ncbi:hypothetical protein MRB53_009032 [Persea americana]|uniref:Uncharacterized protein n=1 Tax=Persea americana TaxID=3435 RepID=A0ACC2LN22_PERAE|nr:hypothetical protein MRB53_009032 [Persea americana]